jgi:hypothetical protein
MQNAIYLKTGVHPEDQLLLSGGRQMEGHRTLSFYQVKDGATLHLELRQPRRHRDAVPRGTFEEPAMVAELKTRATTIRKSMIKINQLHKAAGGDLQDMTKLVQWMNRKEFCLCQIFTLPPSKLTTMLCMRQGRPRRVLIWGLRIYLMTL